MKKMKDKQQDKEEGCVLLYQVASLSCQATNELVWGRWDVGSCEWPVDVAEPWGHGQPSMKLWWSRGCHRYAPHFRALPSAPPQHPFPGPAALPELSLPPTGEGKMGETEPGSAALHLQRGKAQVSVQKAKMAGPALQTGAHWASGLLHVRWSNGEQRKHQHESWEVGQVEQLTWWPNIKNH